MNDNLHNDFSKGFTQFFPTEIFKVAIEMNKAIALESLKIYKTVLDTTVGQVESQIKKLNGHQ